MPKCYRQPKIPLDPAAMALVVQKLGDAEMGRLVLLLAGRDEEAGGAAGGDWRAYAASLADAGFTVALVGNRGSRDFATNGCDSPRCLDLTDKLSVDELIALVSAAPLLVTNSPQMVQVAGAFDRWIGLFGAGLTPEYLLPWRHGSQSYRTRCLGGAVPIGRSSDHASAAQARDGESPGVAVAQRPQVVAADIVQLAHEAQRDWQPS